MDKRARQAAVQGVTKELDTTEKLNNINMSDHYLFLLIFILGFPGGSESK